MTQTTEKPPFDPHAPYIDDFTGLEYEDAAARLLGTPKDSLRNREISYFREKGYPEDGIRAFWQVYDAAEGSLSDAYRAAKALCGERWRTIRQQARDDLVYAFSYSADALLFKHLQAAYPDSAGSNRAGPARPG